MGKWIIIERTDCSGKSTGIKKLKKILPVIMTDEKFMYTREPGNLINEDSICEEIRYMLNQESDLNDKERTLLLAASR